MNDIVSVTVIILLLFICLFIYAEVKKEHLSVEKREMYVPNCNFLNGDLDVCASTRGCKVVDDKCYYDWINLQ